MDPILTLFAQAEQQRSTADLINDLARTPLSQVVIFITILSVFRLAMFPYLKNKPAHMRTGLYKAVRFFNEVFDAFVYAGAFVFLLIRPFAIQTFRIPSGSMWPTLYVNDFIIANKAIYRYTDPKFGDIVVFRPPVDATVGHPEQVDESGEVKVDFIKRLIGLPGDVIELREGVLYRNGEKVADRFRHYSDCIKVAGGNCEDFRLKGEEEVKSLTLPSFKFVNYKGQVIPLNYTPYDANSVSVRSGPSDIYPPYSVAPKYTLDDPAVAQSLVNQAAQPIPKGYYFMMGDNRNNSFDGRGWGLVPREAIVGRSEFIWLPFSRWSVTR